MRPSPGKPWIRSQSGNSDGPLLSECSAANSSQSTSSPVQTFASSVPSLGIASAPPIGVIVSNRFDPLKAHLVGKLNAVEGGRGEIG